MQNRLWKTTLCTAVLLPPLFLFFAIQHSAITVPFWDHCELIRHLERIHDQQFRFSDLWAPHNHSRPFTFRAVLLLNAVLTDWDIRSEYIYMLAAIYGAFLIQGFALWRVAGRQLDVRFLALLAALSVVSFSPVGHNNHWWSMMLQLNLTHLLIVLALTQIAAGPDKWSHNLIAAIACWLATYTLTNGLVAFAAAAAVAQLAGSNPLRINRFSLFWVVNIAAVLAVYLPGLPQNEFARHPGPWDLAHFFFVYLGAPLGGLLRFQFQSQFDIPRETWWNAMTGIGIVAVLTGVAWKCRDQLKQRSTGALLFVGFTLFALGSSVLTAWGRAAFDDYGVAAANGSRYTIFGAYLIYGLLYLATTRGAGFQPAHVSADENLFPGHGRTLRWAQALCGVALLLAATNTYAKSVAIYQEAHRFNKTVSLAFSTELTNSDHFVHPDPGFVSRMKAELKQWRIGPYRGRFDMPELLQQLAQAPPQDEFGINGTRIDADLGPILFAHPHARFQLPVNNRTRAVRVGFGLLDGAWQQPEKSDGVEFRLVVEGPQGQTSVIWSRSLRPAERPADRGPQQVAVDFSAADGSRLLFETHPGAMAATDWAYWNDLTIRADAPAAIAASPDEPQRK